MSNTPGSLDQTFMEDIARHCPQQLMALHQCMSKPQDDSDQCGAEIGSLNSCIRSGVPVFQKIETVCSDKLKAYETCLRSNDNDQSKCGEVLRELRACASSSIN